MGNAFQIAGLVLVGIGTLLILLGGYVSLRDWNSKRQQLTEVQRNALGDLLTGLAKLADAIKNFPRGQQMIVWGIVIVIIGGVMGGVAGLK